MMIVVAHPGAWEEALGICFMHNVNKPIRTIYLVNQPSDKDESENEALLLCPTIPFNASHEIAVKLKDACELCGGTFHRAVRRHDVGQVLRARLQTQFSISIHYVDSVQIQGLLPRQVSLIVDSKTIKADQVIVVSKATHWNWNRITGVPYKLQITYGGTDVSHWKATPISEGSTLAIQPLGIVPFNDGDAIEWVLTSREQFILKLNTKGAHSSDVISKILRRNGWPAMNIRSCARTRKWSLSSWILSRFTQVALASFLKRWIMMYLQTWLRVAAAVFFAARTQMFSGYVTFFAIELIVSWFFVRIRLNGFFKTMFSFARYIILALERSEARVRSSTRIRFFSFTLVFTFFQLLVSEMIKFLWSQVERWWRGKPPIVTPVLSSQVVQDANEPHGELVDLVLLNTETSFSLVNYSRFVLGYWTIPCLKNEER